MKITKSQLKQIIKEELEAVMDPVDKVLKKFTGELKAGTAPDWARSSHLQEEDVYDYVESVLGAEATEMLPHGDHFYLLKMMSRLISQYKQG